MSKTTPATVALTKAGVAFDLFPYAYDPDAPRVGVVVVGEEVKGDPGLAQGHGRGGGLGHGDKL